jgi:hypothetical protein
MHFPCTACMFILSAIYDVFASNSTVTQGFSHCRKYESVEVQFLSAEKSTIKDHLPSVM